MPVSAGRPRLYNWRSVGYYSFVRGLSLVRDGDMVLTSQGVVVFSEAFPTGEKEIGPLIVLVISLHGTKKQQHKSDNEHPTAEGKLA